MEIQEVITTLKDKFGDKINVEKITEQLKNVDLSKYNFSEIVSKLNLNELVGDLDGDGVKEGFFQEVKGKATEVVEGIGHMFHKA